MRLLGRDAVCARLDSLLDTARQGGSGALVLVGEPGIGKTELLDYASGRADEMTVLTTRGVESESELAFAGLATLLGGVLDCLDRIPEPQADALCSALALGPDASPERFATAAGTFSLLGAVAERTSVLALIDDAHWLDTASAEALLFVMRRLEREGVAVLVAMRPGEGPFFRSGFESIDLPGLDDTSAAVLLSEHAPNASPEVASELLRVARGNPLALRELPAQLTQEELTGQAPLSAPLPVGPSLGRAFLRRVRLLPRVTQTALLVAAAAGTTPIADVLAALELLGLAAALEPAEAQGLVAMTLGSIQFVHPLVRSAVYDDASPADRRRVHSALAETAAGRYAQERAAWHRAAAATGTDEEAAAALEGSAVLARRRGGVAAEADLLARSAELTPDSETRSRRRLAAANAARLAGRMTTAVALADLALAETDEPVQRARVRHLQARLASLEVCSNIPWTALVDAADDVEVTDPDLAIHLLASAAYFALQIGLHDVTARALDRAENLAERLGERLDASTAVSLANTLVVCGRESEGYALAMTHRHALEATDVVSSFDARLLFGITSLWVEEYDTAREVLERTIDAARALGAPGFLPLALDTLALVNMRLGRWTEAYVASTEALNLAEATGQWEQSSSFLSSLANIESLQGRQEECRVHAAQALDLAEQSGHALHAAYARAVLGRLELSLGDADEAIRHLTPLEEIVRSGPGLVEPGVVPILPELVEAYVLARRPEEARSLLDRFEVQAARAQSTWALAATARCRGLLAPEDEFERHFREALEWHAQTPRPFERARTELCFGERLRRARRHVEARQVLRSSLQTFEQLGAVPWATRAARELGTGRRRSHERKTSALNSLSAKELQVALTVARGATNREAGAALFVSPKTIEAHLSRVYVKLGIRSRTELAALLAGEERIGEPRAMAGTKTT